MTPYLIRMQYGRMDKSIVHGQWSMGSPKSPQVILIKDAHCHYEAQRNIAKILDILIRDYKVDLVAIEGKEDGTLTINFSTMSCLSNEDTIFFPIENNSVVADMIWNRKEATGLPITGLANMSGLGCLR